MKYFEKLITFIIIIYIPASFSVKNDVIDNNYFITQNLFCWKIIGKSSQEGHMTIHNIEWPNETELLTVEEAKLTDNGSGIACSQSDLPSGYISRNCWALVRQETPDNDNINFVKDILHQYYPHFKMSSHMDHTLNQSQPICFLANEQRCDDKSNSVKLKFDSKDMENLKSNSFAFEKEYKTLFVLPPNSLRICFLNKMVRKLIDCTEQPYAPPIHQKFPVIFKRESKTLERNPICIPSKPTLKERAVYSTPPEMMLCSSIFHGMSTLFLFLYIIECFIFHKFTTYPRVLILWLVISLLISRCMAILLLNLWMPSDSLACFILVYIYRIFMLAIYCCFAIASFDIWHTLRTSSKDPPTHCYEKGRLFKYAIFAWGIPLLLATAELITEHVAPPTSDFHYKHYGNSCAYWSKVTQNLFYSIPTALILFTNFFFFISAYIKLKEMKSLIPIRNRNQKLAVILLRIALLCGFPWVVSLAADVTYLYSDTYILYYMAIVVCSCQAFFILLFFGCQKQSREKLKKKITFCLKGHISKSPVTSDVTSTDLSPDMTNIPVYILQNSVKFPYKTNIL